MIKQIRRRKGKHCHALFIPDARNAKRQRFCSKQECRKASKAFSQGKWLEKEENKNYFRGSENVRRVQQWRKNNPGYWRLKNNKKKKALQDSLSEETLKRQGFEADLMTSALQEVLTFQPVVLIGLISLFVDSALQDDIAITTKSLLRLGRDILNHNYQKGGKHDQKTSIVSFSDTHYSETVQLGGSPSGP